MTRHLTMRPPWRAIQIMDEEAARFDYTWQDITGPRRTKKLAAARHAAMIRCRHELTMPGGGKFSTPTIGGWFNRDHTVVCYAEDRFNDALDGCLATTPVCDWSTKVLAQSRPASSEARRAAFAARKAEVAALRYQAQTTATEEST